MFEKSLKCVLCGKEHQVAEHYFCEKCSGILNVEYEFTEDVASLVKSGKILSHPEAILPINAGEFITIGQGNTPLVECTRINKKFNLGKVLLKCEYMNPTGSFKDRPVSSAISVAKKMGKKSVVVASSGNGAAAVSAFSARAAVDSFIFVPENTPSEKVKQTMMYGGQVIKVAGPYSNSYAMCKKISDEFKVMNLTSTFINPYTLEGDKVVAYELNYQMTQVPDTVFVPIGAGPLLVGIFKGYKELYKMGIIKTLPKMVGVQADGCNPIARAFEQKSKKVTSENNPKTVAGGICDGLVGYTQDGEYVLKIIEESKGWCLSCSDKETLEAQCELARYEGVFVEPSSAIAIAAIKKSIALHYTTNKAVHVALLTGSGLKDMSIEQQGKPIIQANTIDDVRKIMEQGEI